METAQGEKVVCAAAIPCEGNHMTYRPFDSFLQDYRTVLPSSRALEWNFRFQLAAWLDGIVYYSFLQYSEEDACASSLFYPKSCQICAVLILQFFAANSF